MKRRRRPRDVVRVRVPEGQAPFFSVGGKNGGSCVSLLWNFGATVLVSWSELRRLLASSEGDIVIGRRLAPSEQHLLEQYRRDIDHEVHARLISREDMRWRSPRKR